MYSIIQLEEVGGVEYLYFYVNLFDDWLDNLINIFLQEKKFNKKISYFSGVNFQDLMVRLGVVDSPPKTPFILGTELIGTVTAVGPEVSKVKVS